MSGTDAPSKDGKDNPSASTSTGGGAVSALLDLSGKVIVKAQLYDDIRRVPIQNEDITLDELVLMMQRVFQGKLRTDDDIIIKYQDEDGDMITIQDTSDLSFAIACFRVLKLKIIIMNPELPTKRCSHNWEMADLRRDVKEVRDMANSILDFLDSKAFLSKSTTESTSQTTLSGAGSSDKDLVAPDKKDGVDGGSESSSAQQTRRTNSYSAETKEFDPLQSSSKSDAFAHLNKQAQAQFQQHEMFGDVNKLSDHDRAMKEGGNVSLTSNPSVGPVNQMQQMQPPTPQQHQPPPPARMQGPPQPGPIQQAPQMSNQVPMSIFPPAGGYNPATSVPYSGYNSAPYGGPSPLTQSVSGPGMGGFPGNYNRPVTPSSSASQSMSAPPSNFSGPSPYGSMSVNVNQPMSMVPGQPQAPPPPSVQDHNSYGASMPGGPPPPSGVDYRGGYNRMTAPPAVGPNPGAQGANPYIRPPAGPAYKQ